MMPDPSSATAGEPIRSPAFAQDTTLFERFAPVIRALNADELAGSHELDARLLLARDGRITVCYTPFEHVNPQARVVLVGITPGRTQFVNAVNEARRQLDAGSPAPVALAAIKQVGAFSGPLRRNLIALLDHIGLQRRLGLASCTALFDDAGHRVQMASVLRNAVFVDGRNYNGTPDMTRHPLLRTQLLTHFGRDLAAWPDARFIPLGDNVARALYFLAGQGLFDRDRILDGLPHPSGANAERIAYFLGRKPRATLSGKTDPDRLDAARERLTAALARPD